MSLIRSELPRWQQWWLRLRILIDQILMILDLPTLSDSPELRMSRLRRIYYEDPAVTIKYRRVRDLLRGHVSKQYFDYYEHILSVERVVFISSRKLGSKGGDILYQTQQLGDKIIKLVDEIEDLEKFEALYQESDGDTFQHIQAAKQALLQRIDDAVTLQKTIPARLLSLGSSRAERGIDRLQERIHQLALELDDIADSYDEIDDVVEAFEEGHFSHLSNDT